MDFKLSRYAPHIDLDDSATAHNHTAICSNISLSIDRNRLRFTLSKQTRVISGIEMTGGKAGASYEASFPQRIKGWYNGHERCPIGLIFVGTYNQ